MSRKLPPKSIPLEKIPESLSGEYDQPAESLDRKRINISTFLSNLPNGQKAVSSPRLLARPAETKMEEKDRQVKQLQEEIHERKLKNDMVQLAFQRRNEAPSSERAISKQVRDLLESCKILVGHSKPFKKAYLRSLVAVCKTSEVEKSKAVKLMLTWTIGWLSRLFCFLSGAFSKK